MKGRLQRKAEQIFRVVERMGKSEDPDWEKEEVPLRKGMHISVECVRMWMVPSRDGDCEDLMEDMAERDGRAISFEIYAVSDREGEVFSASFPYNPYVRSEWPSVPMGEIGYLLRCATSWD